MKAIKFKEKDKYSLTISKGVYLVDGVVLDVDSYNTKIEVKDIKNVRPITRKTVVDYYVSGENKLSVDEYLDKSQKLLLNRKLIDEDEYVWDSLDSEFEYRRFISKWNEVTKDIENIGEPFSIEIVESCIDSGNEFIKSEYINGGKDPLLFIYDRKSAVLNIVRKKFKELGMEFVSGCSYSDTANKKIWTNSTHSTIRYVAAFNKYIFNDAWDIKTNPRGDMNNLLAKYKSDKEYIESLIETKYKNHFGYIDSGKFNFIALLDMLRHSKNMLEKADVKQKSISIYRSGIKKLSDSIDFIETSYELK